MSTRFFIALCIVIFQALLVSRPEANAQVQNGSLFNSEGPAPNTGPAPAIQSGDNPPNGSTAGAIQAIAADPANPRTIYVSAVNGGIWKTTDGGASWTPQIDQKASLSIASLALDPTDPSHKTLIAGTGITSNGAFGSLSLFPTPETAGGLQNGLLYSRNGGTTWARLGEATLSGQSVVDVAARGSTILAATFEPRLASANRMTFTGGLFRSSNSGATFIEVSGAPGSGLPAGPVSSLVGDPSNPNVFYAAVTANSARTLGQTSVYVSRNAGVTWQPVFNGASSGGLIPGAAALMRQTFIRVAAGPNNTLALGLVDAGQGRLIGLFYSSNAGATWRELGTPNVNPPNVNPGGQAGINLGLAIDPNNGNLVYVMGDNVAGGGAQDENGNGLESALAIFRVNAATNTASRISDDNNATGNTANGSWVHADGRVFAFDANGALLTSTDSGLYARTNPQSSTDVWKGLLGNLSVMELYALAYDSNSKRLVVATQDNAMAYQSAPGSSRFNVVGGGGDGLNAAVNDVTLGNHSVIYVSSQELFLRRLIVDETGTIISPFQGSGVSVGPDIPVDRAPQNPNFFSPFVLNNIDKTRIAVAFRPDTANPPPGSAVYVTQDTLTGANGPGATQVVLSLTELGDTDRTITKIDYGTRNNPNALLAGGDPGSLFLSTSAAPGSLRELTAYSGLAPAPLAPTSVKFDLRSDQRFFVADSVDLFGSVNHGASFRTLTGNLPANFVRPTSLAFVDSNGVDALLVGGLNNADNAGNPIAVADSNASGDLSGWRRFGSGLPNTTIFALSYNEKSDTLAVGTVGRGAYLLYDVTSNFASARVLQFGLADNDSNPDPAILFGNRPLVKYGTGTLTINGPSTYTGTTTVLSGMMAAGVTNAFAPTSAFTVLSGATLDLRSFNQVIGSLAGIGTVTSNGMGPATLTTGNDNTNTIFSGTIANGSGTLGLTKIGLGTFTLSGTNTYSGGTLIQAGTLVAGTVSAAQAISFALGTGNVSLQGGTLRTPSLDPLVINVGGNYVQGPAGTLALGVGGVGGKDYDRVQVGGNASLNGTLAVSSVNNFRPSSGNAFEVLRTNGSRSGQFARVNDSLNNSPNLERVDLYAPNLVALVYVSGPARPPIVDVIPTPLPPVLTLAFEISLLDPTAEQLTSLYEISFSGANTQRFNLEERLAEIQRGSTGFASNLRTALAE
jgi:autotransporter-associated beta strand protein